MFESILFMAVAVVGLILIAGAVPQMTTGAKYQFLEYQVRGRVLQADEQPNVKWRDIILNLFYGPRTGCDSEPNSPGQKGSLATATAAEVLAAGQGPIEVPNLGSVQPAGFMATFMTPLLSAISVGWVNNGIYGRWFDTPTDPFQSVGTFGDPGVAPAGGGGAGATITTLTVDGGGAILTYTAVPVAGGTGYNVGDIVTLGGAGTGALFRIMSTTTPTSGIADLVSLVAPGTGYAPAVAAATTATFSYQNPDGDGAVGGDRLPLDNNATIRRYTAIRGKSWRGNIRPAPIAESQTLADQFTPAAQALWKAVANGMYTPISDGESILYPLLISATESQLIRTPTRVAYAPLVLPGIDPVTGSLNAVVDLALGESKRRKERKSVTF